ncbi:hypothetical protein Tco_1355288 [Tanacetum coccineum]
MLQFLHIVDIFKVQCGSSDWIGVPAKDSIPASLSDVDILEVEAQEVESFDLGSEVLILESLEAKSFELTFEDLSLLSQETKSLDTKLESPKERIKRTKRSKNSQKPTRNERDKNKSEETARNQKPDQPDTAIKEVKGQHNKVKGH